MESEPADMDEWLWPEACTELRQLEHHLRCQICGDFFHGPVLLPCSHSFCSECVRRYLQSRGAKGNCPECKQSCAPNELISNRSMEKVVLLFQQLKPKLLPIVNTFLDKQDTAILDDVSHRPSQSRKPLERVPLLSYNVMKDKEIRKLLEGIGIRTTIKSREDIIQIHKDYCLMVNAQADSCNPKSLKQIREHVMSTYRARRQEKQRNSVDTSNRIPSEQMTMNFEKLKQDVLARKANTLEKNDSPKSQEDVKNTNCNNDTVLSEPMGVWRYVHVLKNDQKFYIHSETHEIRLEAPPEYIKQQANPNNLTKDGNVDMQLTNQALDLNDDEFTSHGDDDFEIISAPSPTPRPVAMTTPSPRSDPNRVFQKTPPPTSTKRKPYNGSSVSSFFSPEVTRKPVNNSQETFTLTKWECPRCTLVNEPSSHECEACQHRPNRKKFKLNTL